VPPETDPARRAVVTGLGAVTPIGNDAATFWTNLLADVESRRVERGDRTAARNARKQVGPERRGVVADRSHRAEAGHHGSTGRISLGRHARSLSSLRAGVRF